MGRRLLWGWKGFYNEIKLDDYLNIQQKTELYTLSEWNHVVNSSSAKVLKDILITNDSQGEKNCSLSSPL